MTDILEGLETAYNTLVVERETYVQAIADATTAEAIITATENLKKLDESSKSIFDERMKIEAQTPPVTPEPVQTKKKTTKSKRKKGGD